MADQDLAAQEADEQREAAKQDARILVEAEIIKSNTERFTKARAVAGEMALESANQSNAFASVASGSLEYPEMERERAETQSIAVTGG